MTICRALDTGKAVRVVFYDISKTFDRIWHAGLIKKKQKQKKKKKKKKNRKQLA